MKKLLAVLGVLLATVAPAAAQNTRAQLNTQVTTNFPDNTTGLITPAIVRTQFTNFITSFATVIDPNTYTATNTFQPASGDAVDIITGAGQQVGLNISQSPTFSLNGSFIMNKITVADGGVTLSAFGQSVNALTVDININGTIFGARQAFTSNVRFQSGTIQAGSAANFMVGGAFGAFANANPCAPSAGTCDIAHTRGSFTGINPVAGVADGVLNINGITGGEVDIESGPTSTMQNRVGWDIVLADSFSGGSVADYGLYFNATHSTPLGLDSLGWNWGIRFDKVGGVGAQPVRNTGTIMGSGDAWTVASVFDFSSLNTATGFFLKGPGNTFKVDGVGKTITGGGSAPGSGSGNAALSLGGIGAFPAIWVQGAGLRARLSDDSADTSFQALTVNASTGFQVGGAATSAHYLRGNGTNYVDATAATVAADLNGLSAASLKFQNFTSNGTFTIPANTVAATQFKFIITGAGGGGGGAATSAPAVGGGGAAGATCIKWLSSLTAGNTITVSPGSGGAAGSSAGGNGGTGNSSTISSGTQTITTVTAAGGAGGTGNTTSVNSQGAAGGTCTNADLPVTGGDGFGSKGDNINAFFSGNGGPSAWGGGGHGVISVGGAGTAGAAFGSGGGGGATNAGNQAGGAGANGLVRVEWVQ